MIEAHIDNTQLNELIKDLNLTERQLMNLTKRVFKTSAKDFSKRVIKRANSEYRISKKKLNQRIRQYVVNNLTIKVFSGFYRTGLTNWVARQTKRGVSYASPNRKLREHAFIANMPEGGRIAVKRTGKYKIATKGRYQGKKRETLQKQVTESGEIEKVIEPILLEETENFYKIFKDNFEKQITRIQ